VDVMEEIKVMAAPSGALASAVSGIWEKFRGATLERVARLEAAAAAAFLNGLSASQRRDAERDAHKLAGTVGTFGFTRGSELARQIEALMEGTQPLDGERVAELVELTGLLRRELERPTQAAAEAGESRASLLVIDEDRDFADRVVGEAQSRGLTVRVVYRMADAPAAIAAENPDVVLLDPLCYGDMRAGLALLTEITAGAPARPVLIASGESAFASRLDAARFGARGFLQKPLTPAAVVDAALHTLQRVESAGTVLVVDDDPVLLGAVRALLEPTGLTVATVEDPRTFWDALESVRPDLVMLDVDMPHVNGMELCRVVRNESRWSTLPVIFLTARTDAETLHGLFAAGADDYVAKPFIGPELSTRIANRLERVRLYQLLADMDALTGVANRRKSEENITQLMALAARQGQPLSLAVIDLDHFKRINDRYGHAVGDEVLRRVSKRLKNALRGEDVIGRWGGEEFVIGAFGAEKSVLVRRLNEVLIALRAEGVTADGEVVPVTFSAGVAAYLGDGSDLASVYRAADAALYQGKALGREQVVPTGWTQGEPLGAEEADIVLVEDDPGLAELLLHAFTTNGYRARWFRDGEAAMELLHGPDPALRARLILLDVNLPGQDGFSVLKRLTDGGVTRDSRVIMLTVQATEDSVVRSRDLGAIAYVAKPFSVPVLMRRIRGALNG
jgi:diguanylate cyclase (GGDEF)-like protein